MLTKKELIKRVKALKMDRQKAWDTQTGVHWYAH
jgi:hypothetical protein